MMIYCIIYYMSIQKFVILKRPSKRTNNIPSKNFYIILHAKQIYINFVQYMIYILYNFYTQTIFNK